MWIIASELSTGAREGGRQEREMFGNEEENEEKSLKNDHKLDSDG